MKIYNLRDPKGVIHTFNSLSEFAVKHGLDPSALSKVLRNKQNSHKGWKAV